MLNIVLGDKAVLDSFNLLFLLVLAANLESHAVYQEIRNRRRCHAVVFDNLTIVKKMYISRGIKAKAHLEEGNII